MYILLSRHRSRSLSFMFSHIRINGSPHVALNFIYNYMRSQNQAYGGESNDNNVKKCSYKVIVWEVCEQQKNGYHKK